MPENATNTIKGESDEAKLARFKKELALDADLMDDQRDMANRDMRFVNVPGGMWEDFREDVFGDRTKLEFDLASDYLNRFLAQWANNPVGVEYKPDDSKTSDEDAEFLSGIHRADFRQFSGEMAIDNAVSEAGTCGYGAYKLAAFFEDEGDPENEKQRIEHRPIYNAYNSVFWDSSAKRPDKKDARRCHELTRYSKDAFAETYAEKKAVSAYTPNSLSGLLTDKSDSVFVATRYEVVKKRETIFVYHNLETQEVETFSKADHDIIKDELKADDLRVFVRERKIIKRHIEKTVFSGAEFLEKSRLILGSWIPIIPVYAFWSYVDGSEQYRGLIRKLIDAVRLFNMQVSKLAESSASAGGEIPIVDPEQIAGLEAFWEDPVNAAYLPLRALTDGEGNKIASGVLGYLKAPLLDGNTAALMQIVPAFIQQITGGAPQDTLDPDASGKAIQAVYKRSDMGTVKPLKNFAVAIEHGGEVYQSMASALYTDDRIIRIVGKDGTESSRQLSKTVMDEETGRVIQVDALSGKKFRAYADVGPRQESQREQTVEDLKGMLDLMIKIPNGQDYIPVLVSILLANITGVGLQPLKDFNRKKMILQGIEEPETDEEKQMLAQAQQPTEDPNKKLMEAAAQQQLAEARNLDASALDKVASAEKKGAETAKIISETENSRVKTLLEIRTQVLARAKELPFVGV